MTHFGQLVCWCGREYAPTTDGRTRHRMLQGHTPCDRPPAPPGKQGMSPRCRVGRHEVSSDGCGGGFFHGGDLLECTCQCHGGPRWRDDLEAAETEDH